MDPTQHIQDEILITVYNLEDEHASVVNMDSSHHIQAKVVNIVNTTVLKKTDSYVSHRPKVEGSPPAAGTPRHSR